MINHRTILDSDEFHQTLSIITNFTETITLIKYMRYRRKEMVRDVITMPEGELFTCPPVKKQTPSPTTGD